MNTLRLWTALMAICILGLLPAKADRYLIDGFEYEFNGHEASVTGCSLSGDVIIPETVTYNNVTYTVTSIAGLAFYCDHKVTSIRMPNTVKTVKREAFIHASELRSVYFPSSIEKVDWYAFSNNVNLTSIFCSAIVPPDFGEQGFDGRDLDGRISLYVPNGSVEAYQSAPYFEHFKNIIPIDVWDFVEDGIYYHIVNQNNVTVTFKDLGFATYSGSVVIPETVTHDGNTYQVTGIAGSAFAYCDNLASVAIPVTIKSVGNDAFFGCSLQNLIITGNGSWTAGALTLEVGDLFIGSGVNSIAGMKVKASDIYCLASIPPACDDFTFTSYDAALHVPPKVLSSYFTAPYWYYFIDVAGDVDFTWPTSLQLSPADALLEIGEEMSLNATPQPSETSYKNIYWASSNPSVASVNDGIITALAEGECDIIASCLTVKAICHIAVVEKKIIITLDRHTVEVRPNHMITLTPTLTPISTDLVVASSNPGVAAVRLANGKVQVVGITEGVATVTVNSANGYAIPDSCQVTVYTDPEDIDRDGFVDVSDITCLIEQVLGTGPTSSTQLKNDINGDGTIDICDVTALINIILNGVSTMESETTVLGAFESVLQLTSTH